MPKNAATQRLLDEIRTPTHAGRKTAETAILNFYDAIEPIRQQVLTFRSASQRAKLSEDDTEVREHMGQIHETVGAMENHLKELERAADRLAADFEQMERYEAIVRPVADKNGYS